MTKKHENERAEQERCTCQKPEPQFSEDGLIEWCANCGKLICDHHLRKFGTPHPA